MSSTAARRVAVLWTGLAVVAAIAVGVGLLTRGLIDGADPILLLLAPTYAALGLLIVIRQPGNNLAWLLFVVATWVVLSGATELRLPDVSVKPNPPAMWDVLAVVWANTGYFVGMIGPLFLFLYVFPTGHFLSGRWAWAGWVAGLFTAQLVLTELLAVEVGPDDADPSWVIPNPIGFIEPDLASLQAIAGVGLITLMVGGVLAIVVRYRRSDGVVRAQIKWVVFALLLMAGVFIFSIFYRGLLPEWLDSILFALVLSAIPVSLLVAVTRYKLYEIDRLISRSVSYTLIAVILGLVFATGAVWVPTALGLGDSPALVAASTLAVAALFNPLRKRVQRVVDRRFNRSRYQAEQVFEEFSSQMQASLTHLELADMWVRTVDTYFEPSISGVWLKDDWPDRTGR